MNFNYQSTFKNISHLPYERVLLDCMRGDLTLFARRDGIKAIWSAVDPIIKHWEDNPTIDFPNYKAGTWGPKEADELLKKDGYMWHTV